jgi:hypothetical protein
MVGALTKKTLLAESKRKFSREQAGIDCPPAKLHLIFFSLSSPREANQHCFINITGNHEIGEEG